MINPKAKLFKWGPIDGRPIYIDTFVQAFVEYPKFIGVSWPDVCCYYKNDKITAFIEDGKLRDRGEELFKRHVLNDKKFKKAYSQWFGASKEIKRFESMINRGITKENLSDLFKDWNKVYLNFWVTGFLPEIANWGGERLLKEKILEINRLDFVEIFEGLSAPEDFSFFQKEELELLNIKLVHDGEKQSRALEKHQKQYYWLRNNYGFTEYLDIDYFGDEFNKISIVEAERRIIKIENYLKKIKKRKKELIEKHNINDEIVNIAKKLSYCVWWQDYRKKFIFIANHINSEFLRIIGQTREVDFKELCYYTNQEIINLLEDNIKTDTKKRFNGFAVYYHERKSLTYMTGKEASNFVRPYLEVKINKDLKEIKGLVVSKSKNVRGKVKILLTPKNLNKMNKGDILVAPMTSPDFIVAMRKASAIITDEGGMTCHAAIVSRELGIPCIVGTRVATKVLKDGDMVEVDVDKGRVIRL